MDSFGITDEMWSKGERHLKKLLETQPMPEDSSQKRTLMTDNLLPLIPKITAPMLLINGRYDPACTKSQIAYIMNHAKDVTQAIFEDSGHFPRIEEAKKYTDTVWNFLGYE